MSTASSWLPPVHESTLLGAAMAVPVAAGVVRSGVPIGHDLLRGSFCFDPFTQYAAGELSNPNMVVLGQIGRGKSAFLKSFLLRNAAWGRAAFVVDPKGEYGPLAAALGVTPVALRPGGTIRLNPLGAGTTPEVLTANGTLVAALTESTLRRRLSPRERTAVDLAVATAARGSTPLLSNVVEALLIPSPAAAASLATTTRQLTEDGRDVALELRRMCTGDLAGMFDAPTTDGLSLDGPMVVLDLSGLLHSDGVGLLVTCALAWLGHQLVRPGPRLQRYVVLDEAWSILGDAAVSRWFQGSWKLARARGVANICVLHRLADVDTLGAEGPAAKALAAGLVADSETWVIFGQSHDDASHTARALGLSGVEERILQRVAKGTALWRIGGMSHLVRHQLTPVELALANTDAAMVR